MKLIQTFCIGKYVCIPNYVSVYVFVYVYIETCTGLQLFDVQGSRGRLVQKVVSNGGAVCESWCPGTVRKDCVGLAPMIPRWNALNPKS